MLSRRLLHDGRHGPTLSEIRSTERHRNLLYWRSDDPTDIRIRFVPYLKGENSSAFSLHSF